MAVVEEFGIFKKTKKNGKTELLTVGWPRQ
jgi:hypothetical protein